MGHLFFVVVFVFGVIGCSQNNSIVEKDIESSITEIDTDENLQGRGRQFQSGSRSGGANLSVVPDDSNQFLTLVTRNSPVIVDDADSARAYYRTVDPDNQKTTLNRWRRAVGFNQGTDAFAIYINGADLGFARRMFFRKNSDGTMASYVENYATLGDAFAERNVIATVAMELAPPALDPTANPIVTFYTFDGNNQRALGADLDGRGFKFQPGLCVVCHGGVSKPVVNGLYSDSGDVGALFLPYDVATFQFSRRNARFSREALESEFKLFNQLVLDSYQISPSYISTGAPIEVIEGWYGGPGLPLNTFNEFFVPAGWLPPNAPDTAEQLYTQVIGPNCRACHLQRGTILQSDLDFATFNKFLSYEAQIESTVFQQATMPLAKLTFENFWSDPSNAELLASHLPNFSSLNVTANTPIKPGDIIANAGVSQTIPLARTRLNARATLFADSINWTLIDQPAGSNPSLRRTRSTRPRFTPDVAGTYVFSLSASNQTQRNVTDTVTLTVSNDIQRVSLQNDIAPVIQADCASCHTDPTISNFRAANPDLRSTLLKLINFTDPTISVLVTKSEGLHHFGGPRPGFVSPDTSNKEMFIRWITEGARDN